LYWNLWRLNFSNTNHGVHSVKRLSSPI